MTTLVELSVGKSTDKNTVHSYLPVYDKLMARFKDTASNVMEIGCYTGGSLLLWQSYFTNAIVHGLDISPCRVSGERIRVYMKNAYTKETVQSLADKKYEVIVEDGSHTLPDICFVAAEYPRLLTENGLLIIEDIQHPDWIPKIVESFEEQYRDRVQIMDRRSVKGRYDDILIVLDLQ